MAFNYVAMLKMHIGSVLQNRKINEPPISSFDEFSTWPIVSSLFNKIAQDINILVCDNFGNCHIHRNFFWNSKLIELKIRVARDDRSSGKVTSFTHQVAS